MMTGKVFSKEPTLIDGADPDLVQWQKDIDKQGTHARLFWHDVFQFALRDGIAHVLVDMPKKPGGWVSIADEKSKGLRPYLCYINPRNVLGWRFTVEYGAPVLTQIRILQSLTVPDGPYGERHVEQVRVYNRVIDAFGASTVNFEVWEKKDREVPQDRQWTQVEQGTISGASNIPLVTIYTNKTGFMMGEPPLLDLMYLNVDHWQSTSDQKHILHVARVPILFGKAFPELNGDGTQAGKVEIGPNRLITSDNENADLKFVEHSGKAIDAGRNDIQDTENRMAIQGAELMAKRTVRITATEQMHDAEAEDSELGSMVHSVEVGAEQCYRLMLMFAGKLVNENTKCQITFNKDFGADLRDAADLQLLIQARLANQISQATFLSELVRRGVVTSTLDVEDEIELTRTEEEAMALVIPDGTEDDGDPNNPAKSKLDGGKGNNIKNGKGPLKEN
jgi:hypothetical protein